jgi:hypothetical protein
MVDLPDLYKKIKARTSLSTQEIQMQSKLLTDTATGPIIKTLTFTVTDYDHLVFVPRVWCLLDQLDNFVMAVYVNGVRTSCKSGVGSLMYDDKKDDPFLLRYGDYVEVAFVLFEAKAYTVTAIFEYYSQPSFIIPDSVVSMYFYAPAHIGAEPFTIPLTSVIHGYPTTVDWDFGDGSSHISTPSPTHTYSNAGVFTPSLYGSKTGSWDKFYAPNYFKVVARENLASYTEVDAFNLMTPGAHQNYLNGQLRGNDAYLYKAFSVTKDQSFWLTWRCKWTSAPIAGSLVPLIALSPTVGNIYQATGYKIGTRFYRDDNGYSLDIFGIHNTTTEYWGRCMCSLNTDYYCELYHDGGSANIYFVVYTDAARQTVLDNSYIAGSYGASGYSYLIAGSSYGDGNPSNASGYLYDLAILQGGS